MLDINVAQIFISFIVLLFSLTVHEMAHAWTADRLGDPTARLLGRVSLNPLVHADPVGTVLFPLIAMITGAPLIGWAKPVPVNVRQLRHHRRDYVLVAAAGPASNLVMAVTAGCLLAVLPISPQTLDAANVSAPLATLLSQAMRLNVLLAVFNMIPIPPLDGGRVAVGILPNALAYPLARMERVGCLLIIVVMLVFPLGWLIGPPVAFLFDIIARITGHA